MLIEIKKKHFNYIGVKDIDIEKGILVCDIFNPYKSNNVLSNKRQTFIYIDNIITCTVIKNTYFPTPESLLDKVLNNKDYYNYLELINYDNNILRYISSCYKLDNDPSIKELALIDGIDDNILLSEGTYELSDKQFEDILNLVFKGKTSDAYNKLHYNTFAINRFSIDIRDKQYVVIYSPLELNFQNKTLKLKKECHINKSFLINEKKTATISNYLDISGDEFLLLFDKNPQEAIKLIINNFHKGEKINTRPNLFLLERDYLGGVEEAIDAIINQEKNNKLSIPLKAFFGRNRISNKTAKDINIVINNRNKINIDQLRVVYNSLINRITYVKGPPGTGKTETIFNIILSCYANNKTVLICSNNNHPVNDINKKLQSLMNENEINKFYFPVIRIGNNNEMLNVANKIREIFEFSEQNKDAYIDYNYCTLNKKSLSSNFSLLKEKLEEYEYQIELQEKLDSLFKIKKFELENNFDSEIDKQIKLYLNKINSVNKITEEHVLKYVISASEDKDFQKFLYHSSLRNFRKILNTNFNELRQIVYEEDEDILIKNLNSYLRDDANFRRFQGLFPIILCTNLSSEKFGSAKTQFDIVVMDEAAQCNIASSLIPLVRADNIVLVGDTNQLQPVTILEENVNDALRSKYNISKEYDYTTNSILSTMLSKDFISKSILLRYHYRCGKKIANFVNKRFYEDKLKLLNNNPGDLVYVDIKNEPYPNLRNAYDQEANSIVKIIKENKYKDVAIVTPFVNQAKLINKYLEYNEIEDVKAGTIHTLQGSEKSVIIMSTALSLSSGKKTIDWVKNNHELINVAVTRAREKFVFVCDKEALDLVNKDNNSDLKILSDYIYNNGEIDVPKCNLPISYDFSNNSKAEKEFFITVKPYFNRRGSKFKIEKGIPVKDVLKNPNKKDLTLIGRKTFDFVVKVSVGLFNRQYKPIIAFEIDGGEHVGSKLTAKYDRQKEEAASKYGLKIIRIPNNAVKDYKLIIALFETVIGNIKDIEEVHTQLSLFDE